MTLLNSISNGLKRILGYAGGICIATATLVMFLEIIARNFTGISVAWAEETARYATIWAVFLLAGPLLKDGVHIRIEFMDTFLNATVKRYLNIFICCLGITMCTLCLWWSTNVLTLFLKMEMKSITGTPFDPWSWQLPLWVGMLVLMFYFLERLVLVIRRKEKSNG